MMFKETLNFLVAKTQRNEHFSKMPLSYLLSFHKNAFLKYPKQAFGILSNVNTGLRL